MPGAQQSESFVFQCEHLRNVRRIMSALETAELSQSATLRCARVVMTTVAVIVATTVFLVVGACMLPHDRYLRFKSSTALEFAKYGWIYERIHFDKRPI